jgi:DtxR family Mn-dependent transcriptional regulator
MAKTQSTEDYIKAIYRLQQEHSPVATSALARLLRVGDGSATGMIKKLSAKQLIHYEPYRGVSLTASGRKLALGMVRRHRLWEMFLVKYLGYRWDEIHDEAERLEHATSDDLLRRLDTLLGYPAADPHGDPIPDENGTLRGAAAQSLSVFGIGDEVRIVRVSDRDPDLLAYARDQGLLLKRKLTIRKKLQIDGSMLVRVGGTDIFLSRVFTDAIFVESL